jgi:transcriptional regulator with XRE-family HTH domain
VAADEVDGVPERVRETREYLGFSQEFVADRTGLPRSAISDIERGMRKVNSLDLKRLANVFGVSVSYLVGETGQEDSSRTVHAITRLAGELTEKEREEVLRFARFLRHSLKPPKGQS